MSYTQEFLYGDLTTGSERPTTVWDAIHAMQDQRPEAWRAMACEVFELKGPRDAALLQAEGVMDAIIETEAVDVTRQPTRVYIDKSKRHWVEVYS